MALPSFGPMVGFGGDNRRPSREARPVFAPEAHDLIVDVRAAAFTLGVILKNTSNLNALVAWFWIAHSYSPFKVRWDVLGAV